MKRRLKYIFILVVLASCKQVQKVSDAIAKPSARTVFERDLKDHDSLFKRYNLNLTLSKSNGLKIDLPVSLVAETDSVDFKTLSYVLALKRGERLKVASEVSADSLQLLIDLFAIENDSTIAENPLVSNEPGVNTLDFSVSENSNYKLVITPALSAALKFHIAIYREPTFLFPVSGKGNSAIQSFWGATRAGGKRSHKGIDIFASRGTPVIAVTDGFITNTGNRGLGGKQVWLRDGVFGQSLYYAHLDSINVTGGNRVTIGDTLGFVGNTGNARTTSPHLHFGIYTKSGAIDPLPFVKEAERPKPNNGSVFKKGKTRLAINELRVGDGVTNEKIKDLGPNVPLKILSKVGDWFHLQINDSLEGFMHESLILERN